MKLHLNESGQMLIMLVLELALLIGFAALAADVGVLFHSQRQIQTAADAAATAGAVNALDGGSAATGVSDQAAADSAAAANGFTNGQNGVVVTVNTPPTSGYHQSSAYVEVIISKSDPLYFFKVFTGNGTATVAARAVAGSPEVSPLCGWSNTLKLKGSATITAQNNQKACGLGVDSTAADAIDDNDAGTTVNADFLETPGGSAKKQTSPTPVTFINTPIPQPYANLYQPTTADCTTGNTLGLGSYTGSIPDVASIVDPNLPGTQITCFSAANVSLGNLTLGSGLYIFENGVSLSGTVTVNGGTLAILGGSFNQGNGAFSLTAPTSGPYNSIGILQPASNTNELDLQFGNSTETLNSYIYAPGATLYLQDQGGNVVAAGYVANELKFNTGTLYLPNYNVVHAATTPNRVVSLVE